MNLLLVDDETGIREGLAALLRRRGHVVRTAASVREALERLAAEAFDLVVTDWRLPDGEGSAIVAATTAPVIAASGHPEDVAAAPNLRAVLGKPLMPQDLMTAIEQATAANVAAPVAAAPGPGIADDLPEDAAARVRLAVALLGAVDVEVADDGAFVTIRAPLPAAGDAALLDLEAVGGDLRVLAPGDAPTVELRFHRDGRPATEVSPIAPGEPWPARGDCAIDFDRSPVTPAAFLDLLDRCAAVARAGRTVHFLNVPPHLRLHAEVLGRSADLPKRTRVGPRLPAVLSELWS